MMTRQHFQLIADVIANLQKTTAELNRPTAKLGTVDNYRATVADAFADRLAGTNANFDRGRFLVACKLADR